MFENFEKNKNYFIAMAILIVIVVIVVLAVPTLVDDKDVPRLIDADTKQLVWQKKLNPNFLTGIGAAVVISVVYLLMQASTDQVYARTRSAPEVWADIPQSDVVNLKLKDIYGMEFSESSLIPTIDSNVFLLRYPDLKSVNGVRYLALDIMEDWKKRRKTSPIVCFVNDPVSWVFAEAKMVKRKPSATTFLKQGEKLGLSAEELRRRITLAQEQEASRAESAPQQGGYNE